MPDKVTLYRLKGELPKKKPADGNQVGDILYERGYNDLLSDIKQGLELIEIKGNFEIEIKEK